MAEKEESFGDDSFVPPAKELEVKRAKVDSLTIAKPSSDSSSPTWSNNSLSHPPVLPAWRRVVDLESPPPTPPSPPPFKVSSMITSLFSKFGLQKVEPITGVRPVDAWCDEDHVPVVYNKQYDIYGIKKIGLPKQPVLFDKPAQIFSAIKSNHITINK